MHEEDVTSVGSIKCERLDWVGEGAEEWRWVGKGGAVDLGKLIETQLMIFRLADEGVFIVEENGVVGGIKFCG